jgi:septal ring factor EnvC (AmiA/AmiB activator)
MISWQTTVIILLSLAVAALLVMEFLKDRDDAGISADLAESTKQIELQEMEWGKERKALNDQIRKLQTDSKALEAKIKTQDSGN